MALTNYNTKVAIIYSSITGNTEELMNLLFSYFQSYSVKVTKIKIEDFDLQTISEYDVIVIGTYTWGNGEIPAELRSLYHEFERQYVGHLVTGVVGTGDRFYPNFCGAVDEFRDMLYVHTILTATMKIELTPQKQDQYKCEKFVRLLMERIKGQRSA
ncbi:flavodoxin domain-containing protein [Robertmurraya korlensis]|uniref:flavodoxin domain-containing protein n=1 Tax=Robertmurraya korlensis TaxID=519977 RepID=UPI00203B18E0|nr:flavodoxin domain-containing protein [Robertmurraya korlensis]MCM3602962.1 flavodoxin domain-containing protein [Robertmurraya korlensis]